MINLSKRLQTIADLVTPGSRICDVGCDHAYLDIRLLQQETIPSALAMDVAPGPLSIAQQNLMLTGLLGRCETRLSDGLAGYKKGEAGTLVIAGMGGRLMASILSADPDKTESFRELILSPQSEPWLVRGCLSLSGIGITQEKCVEEDGKYYCVMKAVPGAPCIRPDWGAVLQRIDEMSDEELSQAGVERGSIRRILSSEPFRAGVEAEYGPCLIKNADPCLKKQLLGALKSRISVYNKLCEQTDPGVAAKTRMQVLRGEIGRMQALAFALCYAI